MEVKLSKKCKKCGVTIIFEKKDLKEVWLTYRRSEVIDYMKLQALSSFIDCPICKYKIIFHPEQYKEVDERTGKSGKIYSERL